MTRIIECVPNFSEGCNELIINEIVAEISSVNGVKLLHIDIGKAANRTVVTFAGNPDAVVEAAFLAVSKAAELIDMSTHKGEHPRIGATDVLPLIPISGISMDETIDYARKLAKRIGNELFIPVYCYAYAAFTEERKELAYCRLGEYEGLKAKIEQSQWKPDFGPAKFNAQAGATVVGARNFLVAYNVNLNTTSAQIANQIALDIREKGRIKPISQSYTEVDTSSKIGGKLKSVRAIGWFIEEYGIAQVSMNLTNTNITPLHLAFEEVCTNAEGRGLSVIGSEIVGLVPLKCLLDAGRYFRDKQFFTRDETDDKLLEIAVSALGLNDLYEFNVREKIFEYVLENKLLAE